MGLVFMVLPNRREARRRGLDLPGLVTLAVFLVCLLIAMSQGHRHGWDSPSIKRLFVVAGVTFVMFVVIEFCRNEPLVDLHLYKNLGFAIVSVVILINAVNFWASNFMQTILMQRTLDYTPALRPYPAPSSWHLPR
jgi:hypothetical protein